MSEPIKEVLQTLSRHADVVALALEGVLPIDGIPKATLAALRQASALRPASDEAFRLHPRLREYLHDHMQVFPAFQSLTEIGSKVTQLQSLRHEATLQKPNTETLHSLLQAMSSAVYDIADAIDRNMGFLLAMISTKYGNVRTLEAKNAQNRWYLQQTGTLAKDLNRLSRVSDDLEQDAEAKRWVELARLVRQVILSKSQLWQHGLSDIQTLLREELFRTRRIEASLKNLTRADAFLSQQPAWQGLEVDITDELPDVLLRAVLPKLRPHVEPGDSDELIRNEMVSLAQALPPRRAALEPVEVPRLRRQQVESRPVPPASPLAHALKALVTDVATATGPISLQAWRLQNSAALELNPGVWLLFTITALRAQKIRVDLVLNTPPPGDKKSQTFRDAMACCRAQVPVQRPAAAVSVS